METDQERKLFVGCIPWNVDEAILKKHFSQYGEVEECITVLDKISYRSKGYGFVTFTDRSVAEEVLKESHSIFNLKLDVKPSKPRHGKNHNNQRNQYDDQHGESYNPRKIFVGGLPHDLKQEEFVSYFEKFGVIEDGVITYNKTTNTSRGFGFITFESEKAVEDVMKEDSYEIKNKIVEVRRALLEVGRNDESFMNTYNVENSNGWKKFEGELGYDDLAYGVDYLMCCYCGGSFGYQHYEGCPHNGEDPFKGDWMVAKFLPTSCWWFWDGEEVSLWTWNYNQQYNEA